MKRIIAAIAVLLSVMCFAYAYRLQVLGMIQTDVVAVSDRNLAKTLQKGADGDKEPDPVTLTRYTAGATISIWARRKIGSRENIRFIPVMVPVSGIFRPQEA